MIFTVEPGIYDSERGGIRLEDDVLVGADGPVMLSTHPLQLRILGVARFRSYIRRIFSRLPQVAIEHQRRRPLVSRKTQPQSRPGQRCRRASGAGSASRSTASAATAKRTRRGSSARPVEAEAAVRRAAISVPAATACA